MEAYAADVERKMNEAVLRVVVGEGSAAICRHRSGETRAWGASNMSPASCSAIPRRFERGFHTIEIAKQFIERTQTTTPIDGGGICRQKVSISIARLKLFIERWRWVSEPAIPVYSSVTYNPFND